MHLFKKCALASTAAMAMMLPLGCSETAQPASSQPPDLLCYESAEDAGDGNGTRLAFSSPVGIQDGYSFSSAEGSEIAVWINAGMENCPKASSVEFRALDDDVLLSWDGSSPSQSVSVPYDQIESISGGDARLVATVRIDVAQGAETGADAESLNAALRNAESTALAAFEKGLEVKTAFEDGSESCSVYSISPTDEYLRARAENALQEFEEARFEIRKDGPSA